MSEYDKIKPEDLEAQEAYQEYEKQQTATVQQSQVQQEKPRVREGWKTNDGEFFTFANYDNLPAEYKTFLPKAQTKTKNKPDGTQEPIIHEDPIDHRTYRFGVTLFDNGGSSVWARLYDPNKQSSSGTFKKHFYIDHSIEHLEHEAANALLATNETEVKYRHKYITSLAVMKKNPDNTVSTHIIDCVLRQKRVEYGS